MRVSPFFIFVQRTCFEATLKDSGFPAFRHSQRYFCASAGLWLAQECCFRPSTMEKPIGIAEFSTLQAA